MKGSNWLTDQLCEVMADHITSFITSFENGIVDIFNKGIGFSEQKEIVGAVDATTMMSIGFIVVVVLKEIINTYVFETDGDPDGDPFQLMVKGSIAVCFSCCNELIFDTLNRLATCMAKDLNVAVKPTQLFDSINGYFSMYLNGIKNFVFNPIITIFILVYLIFVMITAARAVVRGAELALMKIMLPIFAADSVTVSGERWNAFLSCYAVTFFGYIPQLLCFSVSINYFVKGLAGDNICLVYAAAWLFVSMNVPKFLEKFTYTSGLSKVARGGMMGVMQLSLLRARMA